MEFVKSIINLLISFFQNKTANTKKEVALADAKEEAVVEKIRANSNAHAVQQHEATQDALQELEIKHQEERKHAKESPDADDQQFNSSW